MCPSSDQKAAFIGFDIWPIKAAAQIGRRVKGITKNFSAHPGAGVKRGGIESARSRKKYPLTISGERVSLSHLNLMTLALNRLHFLFLTYVLYRHSRIDSGIDSACVADIELKYITAGKCKGFERTATGEPGSLKGSLRAVLHALHAQDTFSAVFSVS